MKRYLMCSPEFFDVRYRINPWMRPWSPVDAARARRQWETLRLLYERLGHRVDLIDPHPDLPDMVFTANGALVIDDTAWVALFRFPERVGEAALHRQWLEREGFTVVDAVHVHEGEGDFLLAGDTLVAAHGFRTDPDAHREAQDIFDREVLSVRLIDPRWYHLDTAFMVVDAQTVAYHAPAFDLASQALLARRFPEAIRVGRREALAFALNATSDGEDVVLSAEAPLLAAALAVRGFRTYPIEFTETMTAGGSIKCCTLELRGAWSADGEAALEAPAEEPRVEEFRAEEQVQVA